MIPAIEDVKAYEAEFFVVDDNTTTAVYYSDDGSQERRIYDSPEAAREAFLSEIMGKHETLAQFVFSFLRCTMYRGEDGGLYLLTAQVDELTGREIDILREIL